MLPELPESLIGPTATGFISDGKLFVYVSGAVQNDDGTFATKIYYLHELIEGGYEWNALDDSDLT
jgi:hypothetical protein